MSESLIPCFLVSDVSESLRSLTKNEQSWANRSGRSPKMSYHEQFTHIAQRKWAIMRELLRSLTKNEQMSESLVFWANRSFAHFFANKISDSLRKPMSEFPVLHINHQKFMSRRTTKLFENIFYLDVFDINTWQGRLFVKATGMFTVANWRV